MQLVRLTLVRYIQFGWIIILLVGDSPMESPMEKIHHCHRRHNHIIIITITIVIIVISNMIMMVLLRSWLGILAAWQ